MILIRRHRGLSLIDAIMTLVVLGAVTVPISTGIVSLSKGSLQNYREAAIRSELVFEAERLLAAPFSNLSVGTTNTNIDLPGGQAQRTVTITLDDYDGDSNPDSEIYRVVVTLDGREITFFRSSWKE